MYTKLLRDLSDWILNHNGHCSDGGGGAGHC